MLFVDKKAETRACSSKVARRVETQINKCPKIRIFGFWVKHLKFTESADPKSDLLKF